MFHLYRRLLGLRRRTDALRYGTQEPVHLHDDVVAWRRWAGDEVILVAINFASSERNVALDGVILEASSSRSGHLDGRLLPFEAVVVDVTR